MNLIHRVTSPLSLLQNVLLGYRCKTPSPQIMERPGIGLLPPVTPRRCLMARSEASTTSPGEALRARTFRDSSTNTPPASPNGNPLRSTENPRTTFLPSDLDYSSPISPKLRPGKDSEHLLVCLWEANFVFVKKLST